MLRAGKRLLLMQGMNRLTPFDPLTLSGCRYLFFTGKGGVGKTSAASAAAAALAQSGRRVLLVSTDPASNLDDVFGLELGSVPTPIPDIPGLSALNLDPEQAARDYREKVVGPYRGLLPDSAVRSIEEQLSGACTVEIAAFDEFSKLLALPESTAGFDHVLFDTAPTGHTLRLLQLPQAWTGFMADSTHGVSCLGPLSGLEGKRELYSATVDALSDPARTAVLLVARPDRGSLAEAARASEELQALGIGSCRLIINGLLENDGGSAGGDPYARSFRERQRQALEAMPPALSALPAASIPLRPFSITGARRLEELFHAPAGTLEDRAPEAAFPKAVGLSPFPIGLSSMVKELSTEDHGMILLMGKGGVGKTTLAAALALGLAQSGRQVHLTTTDPAAHLLSALGEDGGHPNLQVSRLDPKAEVEKYTKDTLQNAAHLDEEALDLLREDLASPCTEEIAVFRAFARTALEAQKQFVVMDTAPTGHTLLLLDAAHAYHREAERSQGQVPEDVKQLLPRIRDGKETRIIIVTLPEATPVFEAGRLQEDLRRAGIEPWRWIVNQSWMGLPVEDPVLNRRAAGEAPWLKQAYEHSGRRMAVIPWQRTEPVGPARLTALLQPEGEREYE